MRLADHIFQLRHRSGSRLQYFFFHLFVTLFESTTGCLTRDQSQTCISNLCAFRADWNLEFYNFFVNCRAQKQVCFLILVDSVFEVVHNSAYFVSRFFFTVIRLILVDFIFHFRLRDTYEHCLVNDCVIILCLQFHFGTKRLFLRTFTKCDRELEGYCSVIINQ